MAITLPGGFNITNIEPVDARFTVADETARLGFSAANIYEGLIVYQQDTDALYVLSNTGSFSSNAGWSELGSSASTTALSSSLASRVSDLEVFSSSLDDTFATEAELNASSSALTVAFTAADTLLSSSLATALTNEYTAADTEISTSLAASITVNDGRLDTLEGKTLISSSNQIASDISGSFTTVSASLASRITANSGSSWDNLTDVPQDIVSSSLQLASDISGSFTSTSASIAVDITDKNTRLNTLEGKTLVSSSIQIASDISGSFTSLSGSFADRITANSGSDWSNLTNVPQDIVSSSLQLGSDISGSFTSTSSSIATDIAALKVDSGSFSTRVTSLEAFSSSLNDAFTTDAELNASSSALTTAYTNADNVLSSSLATALTTEYTAADTLISASVATDITNLDTRVTAQEAFSSSLDDKFATDADITEVNEKITFATASILANETNIATNVTNITTNAANITTATASINVNETNITNLDTRITAQEAFSSSLDSTFATDADVTAVDNKVTFATASILANETAIAALNAKTLVSSSIQIGSDISGSFTSTSASLAAAIAGISTDFNDIENKPTLISSSIQIGSDISGSFTSTSASIATDITNVSTRVTAQEAFSSSLDSIFATDADITEVNEKITFATASILANETNIATNVTNIATNVTNITTATASINVNETDIATNVTNIATNAANITTATGSINVNETAIAALNAKTLLSSSIQIGSEISGSFTTTSASIASERLKNTTDTLQGDLTVTGTITAQEFFIEFVTSSVIDVSGSTKFGNTADDTHERTGSLKVSGSITGHSFTGDGSGLTNVGASSVEYINVTNRPTLISSSIQIGSDISGSFTATSASIATDITKVIDGTTTVASASNAVTASYALNTTPGFPFTGSARITGSLTIDGIVSGSRFVGDGSGLTGIDVASVTALSQNFSNTTLTSFTHEFNTKALNITVYDNNDNLIIPARVTTTDFDTVEVAFDTTTSGRVTISKGGHILSGSTDWTNIANIPALLSSSIQIASDISGSFTEVSASFANTIGSLTSDYTELTNIPGNIVSSSTQLASDISGSSTALSASISTTTTGLDTRVTAQEAFSSSLDSIFATDADVTAVDNKVTFATASILANETNIATNVTNIATNVTNITTATSSINVNETAIATNVTNIASNAANITTATGSINVNETNIATNVTNITTNASNITTATGSINVNETAIAALNAKTLVSSSNQIASDISGSVTSLSASIATRFDGLTSDYNELQNVPAGIISSSNQIASDISGSFTETSSSIAIDITKIIDGSTLVASASYAVSSSVTNVISENVTEIVIGIKNVSGGTLAAGTPVHTTGVSGNKFEVIAADASTSAMPAIGLLQTSVANNNSGDVVIGGTLAAVNTLGFTAGDNIYVAAGGGLTGTRPTSVGNKVQNIGIVGQVNANGDIIVLGAGRTNDTPNLGSGEIFFGNGNTQNVNFSDTITGSAAYTGLDTRVTAQEAFSSSLDSTFATDADVTAVDNKVTFATASILANETNIATNVTNITTATASINVNETNIATNVTNIATNVTNITTATGSINVNETNIATNAANITTATSSINVNETAIATNVTNIATNATNITTATGSINVNETAIATNVTNIATNAANITTATGSINVNETNIATNVTNIATNAANITTATGSINVNETAIAALDTRIGLNVATASAAANVLTFEKENGDTFQVSIAQSGSINSASYAATADLATTASYVGWTNIANIPADIVSGSDQIASTFAQTILDDSSAGAVRTTIGVDAAGTDNSTNVTLGNTNYLSLSGQAITGGTVPIGSGGTGATTAGAARTALGVDAAGTDNSTDVTLGNTNYLSLSGQAITGGTVPIGSGGTGGTSAGAARTALGVDAAGTDNSTDVTLTGTPDYITISGQVITRGQINLTTDVTGILPVGNMAATALTTIQTAANQTAHLALTAEEGDVVVRSDENKTYMHNGGTAGTMADYTLLATPTDAVTSVNGGTGVVTVLEANTTNVTAAGALMDTEVTNLAQVKAFDSSDYATATSMTQATGSINVNKTAIATNATNITTATGSINVNETAIAALNAKTLISSSLQIGAEISGSFTSTSASLAAAIAGISTDFADIENKPALVSSSLQLASDISGSTTVLSSSIATRFDNLNTNEYNWSGSFSGSFFGNGSALTGVTSTIVEEATVLDTFTSATSKVVNHGFNTKNVLVSVYNNSDQQIIPATVTTTDLNNVTITLDTATTGRVIVAKGGHIVSGSAIVTVDQIDDLTRFEQSISGNTDYTVTHNLNEDYPIVQVYDTSKYQVIPATILSVNANRVDITFDTTFAGTVIVKR